MKRITDEIRNAFATEEEIDFVTAGTRLFYAYAVINEGLRMYPPGPTLAPRRTPHDGMTKIDNQWVPPWVRYPVSAAMISRRNEADNLLATADYRRRPHHACDTEAKLNFSPKAATSSSHSLGSPSTRTILVSPFCNDRRGASQPFGVDPRNCLGRTLAEAPASNRYDARDFGRFEHADS